MTKHRLIAKLRTKSFFRPLIAELERLGIVDYDILAPTGRGHPILKFQAENGEHRIPLPGSPSGGSDAKHYLVNEIRRRMTRSRQPATEPGVSHPQRRIS